MQVRGRVVVAGLGLASFAVLLLRTFVIHHQEIQSISVSSAIQHSASIRLLAVGDINLGRDVGQSILAGDTLFPFMAVMNVFKEYDIVFANLECTLSDQKGETQHPRNNLIFTGPPAGASSLKRAGVTVVSTANNHALDYGRSALGETITHLDVAGVPFVGTSLDSNMLYEPLIIERGGIALAFFACTDVMNIENPMWKRYVASADTGKLLPRVRSVRDSVDFVIVSYHGGEEYTPKPTRRTERFAEYVISAGADVFLGHHPHVPHGINNVGESIIVYSLGNFVFRQPFEFWTQWSFAFAATITKNEHGTSISSFSCLPVAAGLQPTFDMTPDQASVVHDRIQKLSSVNVAGTVQW